MLTISLVLLFLTFFIQNRNAKLEINNSFVAQRNDFNYYCNFSDNFQGESSGYLIGIAQFQIPKFVVTRIDIKRKSPFSLSSDSFPYLQMGGVAIDPIHEYVVLLNSKYLITSSTINGSILFNVTFDVPSLNFIEINYATGKLYGLNWNGSNENLLEIDFFRGNTSVVAQLDNKWIVNSFKMILDNKYYFLGIKEISSNVSLYSVDLESGSFISTELKYTFFYLAPDSSFGEKELRGIGHFESNSTDFTLIKYNTETGEVFQINSLSPRLKSMQAVDQAYDIINKVIYSPGTKPRTIRVFNLSSGMEENELILEEDLRFGSIQFQQMCLCTGCKTGYHLSGNTCLIDCNDGNCYACPANINTCTGCKTGYHLSGNTCLIDCNDGNCDTCPTNINTCTGCKTGYHLSGNTCLIDCSDGNCDTCPSSISTCTSCKSGYHLSGNTCSIDCNVQNCASCTTSSISCGRCNDGFSLFGSSCVDACSILEKCADCTLGICTKCSQGYTLENNVCKVLNSVPGQIYHPQTGKCLAHKLNVGKPVGISPDLSLALIDCEAASFDDYRRSIWKFGNFIKIESQSYTIQDNFIYDDVSTSPIKAFIRPFSSNYAPNDDGAFYFLSSSTQNQVESLQLVLATTNSAQNILWDVSFKKIVNSKSIYFSAFFAFEYYFTLKKGGSVTFTDLTSLKFSLTSIASNNQVKMKTNPNVSPILVLESPEADSATTPTFSSFFLFKQVDYTNGDDDFLKNTFVWNKDLIISQYMDENSNDDSVSFLLRLDSTEVKAKKAGIHLNGYFLLQGENYAQNISSVCTTKYYNSLNSLKWQFFDNYEGKGDFLVEPLNDNSPTVAIKIIINVKQLESCGWQYIERNTYLNGKQIGTFELKGRIGYVNTLKKIGWFWQSSIELNDQLLVKNAYVDNPDSHYWFHNKAELINLPSFGRIEVLNINAADISPVKPEQTIITTHSLTSQNKHVPLEINEEIMVRNYLLFQLKLENTFDNYSITNLKGYLIQMKKENLIEENGGIEVKVKTTGTANNIANFTVSLENISTGYYKLLLQYNLALSTSRRILHEENKRGREINQEESLINLKITNDDLFSCIMKKTLQMCMTLLLIIIMAV